MRTILVLDDNTPEAKFAIEFTFAMTERMKAKILIAHTIPAGKIAKKVTAGAAIHDNEIEINKAHDFPTRFNEDQEFDPQIDDIDISKMDESGVAAIINSNKVWMIIKAIGGEIKPRHQAHDLNVQIILNKVLCPLLLIPEKWALKKVERLVYLADLRYCRIQIVKYLADLAQHWQADLSIVHISAKGLPDIAENYALSIFENEICVNIDYDRVFFNNIKGGNIPRAVDVIIHTMHNDILALIHHRFHFQELLGAYIGDNLPANIIVPLLVFPY